MYIFATAYWPTPYWPTPYCLLPTAYYLLPTAYYLLPTTYCLLPTAYHLLPTAYCFSSVPSAEHPGPHQVIEQRKKRAYRRGDVGHERGIEHFPGS